MRKLLSLILVALFASVIAVAQSQSTTGNIEGRVVDQNGAIVPGVAVSATNQDTGYGINATADVPGTFTYAPSVGTKLAVKI